MNYETGISSKPTTMPFSLLEIDNAGFHALVIRIDSRRQTNTSRVSERAEDLAKRLTQAEAAVAWAAVDGLSNREIAKLRGSAARTVAVQLRSVYRKLGISSRTELAAVIDMGAQGSHR